MRRSDSATKGLSALEMLRILFSCPRKLRPQPVGGQREKTARPSWDAQACPTGGIFRRPPLHGRTPCTGGTLFAGW